jgi:hypothetical protein
VNPDAASVDTKVVVMVAASEGAMTCIGQSAGLDLAQCSGWQALYDSTSGPRWSACADARQDPCSCRVKQYSPIACKDGDITKIELPNNLLEGTIPNEIGQLEGLTNLDLFQNQLRGTIPAEQIGKLSNLTYLGLHNNKLSGSIPTEIGKLAKLTYLLLDHNKLSGSIPTEIGQLANLPGLILRDNMLAGRVPDLNFSRYTDGCAIGGTGNRFCTPLPLGASDCHVPHSAVQTCACASNGACMP